MQDKIKPTSKIHIFCSSRRLEDELSSDLKNNYTLGTNKEKNNNTEKALYGIKYNIIIYIICEIMKMQSIKIFQPIKSLKRIVQ